ncbi:MAG: DNA repair protein RecN [Flavobacteriales bacterium]|nr:DNA repair protein RecN [Flavobacteriales bacterium]
MLQHLSIKNYAIIDALEIDFHQGFSVVTGETGSGKSIILGALQLIMGHRSDRKSVHPNAKKCIIEASFDIENYHLSDFFHQEDIDYEPAQTIVRREVYGNGKSRAFINDCPVNLEQLREFSNEVVDVHSQHQSLLLHKSNYQLQLIDSLSQGHTNGHRELIHSYKKDYQKLKEIENELNTLLSVGDESKSQLDYFSFLHSELESANLVAGEKESLQTTLKRVERREEVLHTLQKIAFTLDNNHLQTPVNGQLQELSTDLEKISEIDPKYRACADRLESVIIELLDLSKESEILLSNIEQEDCNTEELGNRLNLINQLEQKHHVISLEELIAKQNELEDKLTKLSSVDARISELESEIKALRSQLNKTAETISSNRALVSVEIESFLIETIKELGIKNGQFKVSIEPQDKLNEWGKDRIRFLFSANRGMPLEEMSKVASGGETSRLMLAIKALLVKHLNLPCLILDEIDTGVSGEVAGKISKILHSMAREIQLIVISHLPQVAAKADQHYKVEKIDDSKATKTTIRKLSQDERLEELAKMLSGETISRAALENAKALISNH